MFEKGGWAGSPKSLTPPSSRQGRLGRASRDDEGRACRISLASTPPTILMMVGLQGAGKRPLPESSHGYSRVKASACCSWRPTRVARLRETSWRVWGVISVLMSTASIRLMPRAPTW